MKVSSGLYTSGSLSAADAGQDCPLFSPSPSLWRSCWSCVQCSVVSRPLPSSNQISILDQILGPQSPQQLICLFNNIIKKINYIKNVRYLSFKCPFYVLSQQWTICPLNVLNMSLLSKDKMSFCQRTKCPLVKGQNVLWSKDKMSFWKRTFCLLTKGHIWTLCPSMDIMSIEGHNVQICPFLKKKKKDILSFSKRTLCPFKKGHFVPQVNF
jgi:hypothetical protein